MIVKLVEKKGKYEALFQINDYKKSNYHFFFPETHTQQGRRNEVIIQKHTINSTKKSR